MIKIGNHWFKFNEIVSIREDWFTSSLRGSMGRGCWGFEVSLKNNKFYHVPTKCTDYTEFLESDVYQDVIKAAERLSNIYFGNS